MKAPVAALLLRDLTRAEERERARIAGEIHDDTAQVLGAVSLRLERAQSEVGDRVAKQALGRASEEVRHATVRLRSLMFEIMAPAENESLGTAIGAYCAVLLADTGIDYQLEGDAEGLSRGDLLLVYRLVQEALRNVVKHASAARVQVGLQESEEGLSVKIADDGVGILAATAGDPTIHAGLRIIQQRAEAAGGAAETGVGLEGRGTTIEVRMPADEARAR
jgi:signal transduction histidine kinase